MPQNCCLMQLPVRHCGNVSLCVLLHFPKSALCQCCQHQSAICLNTLFMSTWHTKLIISGKRVIWSCHSGPYSSHIVLYDMYQAWGLYAGLCCNKSWIPSTNVLNYDFVSYCLIGWASNNNEAGISHWGHSLVPMLPFQIIRSSHQRYWKNCLSGQSKQQTNIGCSQSLSPMIWAYF